MEQTKSNVYVAYNRRFYPTIQRNNLNLIFHAVLVVGKINFCSLEELITIFICASTFLSNILTKRLLLTILVPLIQGKLY